MLVHYLKILDSGGSMKDRAVPPECAIKVFKTSLNEFKRREEYMRGDHRLPSQGYKKHNPRKVRRGFSDRRIIALVIWFSRQLRRSAFSVFIMMTLERIEEHDGDV